APVVAAETPVAAMPVAAPVVATETPVAGTPVAAPAVVAETPVVAAETPVAGMPVAAPVVAAETPVAAMPVAAPAVATSDAAPAVRGRQKDVVPNADALVAAGIAPTVVDAAPVAPAAAPEIAAVEAASARTVLMADGAAKTVSVVEVLVAAAEAVADAILVTPGLLRGEGEVRIQLRPDVLEGTEVRIAVQGRTLDVAFVPQTHDMSVLIEQCRPQLEQHLAGRIHAFQVAVAVKPALGNGRPARLRDEEFV
ncbi:MAG: hypothetical protein MJ138_04110, partial [Kiritimatiellae bacterium]|nr:hypothetical protein [Kiritimatiellia bacterium]